MPYQMHIAIFIIKAKTILSEERSILSIKFIRFKYIWHVKIDERIQACEASQLDKAAATISGRVERVHAVVKADMRCYEPDYYVDRCNDLADDLKEKDLKEFANTGLCSPHSQIVE